MRQKLNSVLLIDDDRINNQINTRLLTLLGVTHEVHVVLDGREGINFVKSFYKYNGVMPELILLDINMPVYDGFDFLKEYRKLNFEKNALVAMLTTSVNPKDYERVKKFGIDFFIPKPLSQENIKPLLRHLKLNTLAE